MQLYSKYPKFKCKKGKWFVIDNKLFEAFTNKKLFKSKSQLIISYNFWYNEIYLPSLFNNSDLTRKTLIAQQLNKLNSINKYQSKSRYKLKHIKRSGHFNG